MFSFSYNKATSCAVLLLLVSVTTSVTAVADEDSNTTDVKAGKNLYSQTCIACHGGNGKGTIPGVSDLTAVDGPLAKSDAELIASISDGLSTPGAALSMPAKGGNPALTEADVQALLGYLRHEFGSGGK